MKVQVQSAKTQHFGLFILTGMFLIITTTGFARMAYGIVLPFMQEGLSLSTAKSGLLGTILFLGYLLTVGMSGIFTLRLGAKRVLFIGGLFVFVGLFGLVFVPSFWWAAFCMLFAGGGSALVYTPLMSIAIGWFPEKKGTVMGLLLSGAGIGMLLSGFLVPFMIQQFPAYSWRAVWLLFSLITLAVLFLTLFVLVDPHESSDQHKKEKTSVWKNKALYLIAWLYFAVGVVYLIPNIYQTSYMISNGISSALAGTVYAVAGVFSICGGPVWGMISDRIGAKKALNAALLLSVIGDIIPIIFGNVTGFILSAIIWGSSLGGVLLLIQVKASQQVSPKYVSMAIGFISVFYAIGQMLGPGLAGWLIEYAGGYATAYGFGAIVFLICLFLGLGLQSDKQTAVNAQAGANS